MYQSEFNFTGEQLRDAGIRLAVDHANQVHEKWSDKAYAFLLEKFLPHHKRFMTEELRSFAAEIDFPLPPHARAWGGVIHKASRDFIIISLGTRKVKNAKAHRANAEFWERNDERLFELANTEK